MKDLETERLFLRHFKLSDAGDMFKNWAGDPENVKYLSWKAHKNIFETESILKKWISEYSNSRCYRWCITLKNYNEAIGGIDVKSIVGNSCEVGYVLSRKFWNQGIMAESLRIVIEYLFKAGFLTIVASHRIDNPASGRVMEKCGMSLINKSEDYLFWEISN